MAQFYPLTEDIYRLWVPFDIDRTSVFLIRTDEGDILFDAATTRQDADEIILPALRMIGAQPSVLAVSHNHSDHAGGMPYVAAHFPDAVVCAASESELKKYTQKTRLLADGDSLPGGIVCRALTGHSEDSVGLYDPRTKSLVSGDGLQQGGVAKWGTGLSFPKRYLDTLSEVLASDAENIFASHEYVPCGSAAIGRSAVEVMIAECAADVKNIREYIARHPELSADALAKGFNDSHPGHPPISGFTVGRFLDDFQTF